MSKPLFIYPQWIRAKLELVQVLGLDADQALVLSKWFREHMFEIGVDYSIDKRQLESSLIDIEKESDYRMVGQLADKIVELGLFYEERYEGTYGVKIRRTILLAGCAPMIGSEERDK